MTPTLWGANAHLRVEDLPFADLEISTEATQESPVQAYRDLLDAIVEFKQFLNETKTLILQGKKSREKLEPEIYSKLVLLIQIAHEYAQKHMEQDSNRRCIEKFTPI